MTGNYKARAFRLIYLEGHAETGNHFPDKCNSTAYKRRWQYNVTPLASEQNSVTSRLIAIFTFNTTGIICYSSLVSINSHGASELAVFVDLWWLSDSRPRVFWFGVDFSLSLTFWRRNYFLAHPVYKMWIIQELNMLELWNKLHFEEEKTESIYHV